MKKTIIQIFSICFLVILIGAVAIIIRNQKSTEINQTTILDTPTPAKTQALTLEEVKKHNRETDCWMIIEGKIYDVTSFIASHPGGNQILVGCGKDATELFGKKPTSGKPHSDRARTMLEQFLIGPLAK